MAKRKLSRPYETYPFRPYDAWPENKDDRWIHAGHTFGMHLMENVRDEALEQIPRNASKNARRIAEEAVFNTMYAFMQVFDGIVATAIDDKYQAQYVLNSRIVSWDDDGPTTHETIELAPDGDGLCPGIHGWVKREFWTDRKTIPAEADASFQLDEKQRALYEELLLTQGERRAKQSKGFLDDIQLTEIAARAAWQFPKRVATGKDLYEFPNGETKSRGVIDFLCEAYGEGQTYGVKRKAKARKRGQELLEELILLQDTKKGVKEYNQRLEEMNLREIGEQAALQFPNDVATGKDVRELPNGKTRVWTLTDYMIEAWYVAQTLELDRLTKEEAARRKRSKKK
jgi:hypothetical protein